jgi:hypothetical protein
MRQIPTEAPPYLYGLLNPTLSAARTDNPPGTQAPHWSTILSAWTMQNSPVQPNYKLRITVRIGRSRWWWLREGSEADQFHSLVSGGKTPSRRSVGTFSQQACISSMAE